MRSTSVDNYGSARIPRYARALLSCLHVTAQNTETLGELNAEEWAKLLAFCDRAQLTLLLGHLAEGKLPLAIEQRIQQNKENNALRFVRLQAAVQEMVQEFRRRSVAAVLLKGATHVPAFTADPLLRSQGDVDLWFQRQDVEAAKNALEELGYRAFGRSKGRHLDPMIRESAWTWTGDYYAPDLPIPVDLHYELWDSKREFLPGPDEELIWKRCELVGNARQLSPPDMLTFAALHSLMHLLHGDTRLQRVWEIGYFLQQRAKDQTFWWYWQGLYCPEIRRLQVIVFLLAREWFGCLLPELVVEEAAQLPRTLQLWIREYAWSPVEALFHPNKDELWLNLALLRTQKQRALVLWRRLIPVQGMNGFGGSAGGRRKLVWEAAERFQHHATLLPRTCWSGMHWWLRQYSK